MALFLHGFPVHYASLFQQRGLKVVLIAAPDAGRKDAVAPAGVTVRSDAERFELPSGGFAADMPADFSAAVRRRAALLYNRCHVREFFRENSSRPDWIEIANYFEEAVQFYYGLLKQHRISRVIFNIMPHEGNVPLLFFVAKQMGVETTYCFQSDQFADRLWIAEDYEDLGLSPITVPPEIKPFSMPIASELRSPHYMSSAIVGGWRTWTWSLIRACLGVLGSVLVLQFLFNRRAFRKKILKFKQKTNLYVHQWLKRGDYSFEFPQGDFIYFPLHLQPEATTDVLGGDYADQLLAIEELARATPASVTIQVKENPKQSTTMRGDSFFRRLEQIPNVTLLHASISTFELLKRCRALATVTGTGGWEAAQIGKPSIVFGAAWYRRLHGVFDWRELGPDAVTQALAFQPDPEALRRTVDEKSKLLWRGVVNTRDYAAIVPGFDADANDRHVAQSLVAYIEAAEAMAGQPKPAAAPALF